MRIRATAAVLAVASLALAGCSGESDPASSSASPVASVSASPSASPSAFTNPQTIAEQVAAGTEFFSTLNTALQVTDLGQTLDGTGPLTVFAPTEAAFAKLPEGLLDVLLLPENREVLTQILTYHVVEGEVLSTGLQPGPVATVEGEDLSIKVSADGRVRVNGARVEVPDAPATNGVIHVIDEVLVPPDVDLTPLVP